MKIGRSRLMAPAVVLVLTVASIVSVWLLVERADSARQAQLQVSAMTRSVADLQSAPFNADRSAGGVASQIRSEIAADETSISRGLAARSQVGVPSALLIAGRKDLASMKPIVAHIYRLARSPGGLASGARLCLSCRNG